MKKSHKELTKELKKSLKSMTDIFKKPDSKAIEKAAKSATNMFRSLVDALNPIRTFTPIFGSFIDMVSGFTTAANAENIAMIAESLFSEETVETIKRFAEQAEPFGEALADMTESVVNWINDVSVAIEDFDDFASKTIEEGFFSLDWAKDLPWNKEAQDALNIAIEEAYQGLEIIIPTPEMVAALPTEYAVPTWTTEELAQMLAGVSSYQYGGIITSPTLAMIGETETEVVFPLSKLNEFMRGSSGVDPELIVELEENRNINFLILRFIKEGY